MPDQRPSESRRVAEVYREVVTRFVGDRSASRLPSERDLAEQLHVSRVTVRAALEALERDGLVFMRPGGRIRFLRQGPSPAPAAGRATGSALDLPDPFAHGSAAEDCTLRLCAMDLYASSPASVTARWSGWLRRFGDDNPRITVECAPFQAVADDPSLLAGIDILQAPLADLPFYERLGFGLDLAPFLAGDPGFAGLPLHAGMAAEARLGGRILALPFGAALPALVVNARAWDALGQPVPRQWSWAACGETLARMSGGNPADRLRLFGLRPYLASWGLLPELLGEADLPVFSRAIELLARHCRMGPDQRRIDALIDGGLAGLANLTSGIPELAESYPGRTRMLPLPTEDGGHPERITLGLMVRRGTGHPSECWQLLRSLCGPACQEQLARSHHLVPALLPAQAGLGTGPIPGLVGGLGWLEESLARSRPPALHRRLSGRIDQEVVGPELMRWRAGGQGLAATCQRIGVRSRMLVQQDAAPQSPRGTTTSAQ